jgi:hypothetical protein
MSEKPDTIPQDVWDAALSVVDAIDGLGYAKIHTDKVARAILAERERCADLAETTVSNVGVGGGEFYIAAEIAKAIRNPSPAADAPRGASISPAPLGAQNENFGRVQVIGKINE